MGQRGPTCFVFRSFELFVVAGAQNDVAHACEEYARGMWRFDGTVVKGTRRHFDAISIVDFHQCLDLQAAADLSVDITHRIGHRIEEWFILLPLLRHVFTSGRQSTKNRRGIDAQDDKYCFFLVNRHVR